MDATERPTLESRSAQLRAREPVLNAQAPRRARGPRWRESGLPTRGPAVLVRAGPVRVAGAGFTGSSFGEKFGGRCGGVRGRCGNRHRPQPPG